MPDTTRTSEGAARPAAHPGPDAATPDHGSTKWWTLVAVCLGTFMLLLDVTIVNVALPSIQTDLHANFADLQWVVDAYALTLAALLLTAGSVADRFGRKRLYVIGLAVFTGASLLCGVAGDPLLLQLARGLQGIGGAVMFAVSLALLADAFRGKDRGTAFGIWGAVTGLAVAIGPLLGGALVSGLSWRWIFFVNLPLGLFAIGLTVRAVAESRSPQARRPDWAGFILFTGALAALVYGLIESNQAGFGSGKVWGSLLAAALLLAGFFAVEARGAHPMFDLALFRLPTFTGGAVAAFGISATIFAMLLYLTLYLQDVLGYTPLQTGLRLLVLSGGILLTSTVAGRLSSKVPVRWLIGPGLLLVGAGLLLMRGLDLDPPGSRPRRGGHRGRHDQPTAGLHRHRRRPTPAGRHGLRHQLDLPPSRHRHRNSAAGHPVRQPGVVLRHRPRSAGAGPRRARRRAQHRHPVRRSKPGHRDRTPAGAGRHSRADHQRVHHRVESDPARRSRGRPCVRRGVTAEHPQQGLHPAHD